MISFYSIPPLLMAAVTFYVGVYHYYLYLQLKNRRENLTFALSCFSMGAYDLCCAALYASTTTAEGAIWYRAQAISASLVGVFLSQFTKDYLAIDRNRILAAFSGFFAISFLATAFGRNSWSVNIDQPSIKDIFLPFDLHVVYFEVEPGSWTTLMYTVAPLLMLYIIYLCYRNYRRGERRKTKQLAIAMILLFVCSANDAAVAMGAYRFLYLFEYAYMAIVVMMGYSLTKEIVGASRVRERLFRAEALLAQAIDCLPHDFLIFDVGGECSMQNKASREIWGDFLGRSDEEGSENDGGLRQWRENKRRAFAGEAVEGELELTVKGRKRHFYNVAAPILYNGEVNGVLGFNIDIAKLKQTEQALKTAYGELKQLDKLKDDLISNVSHELRTPLVAIKGYLQLLLDREPDPATARKWLAIAQGAAGRLELVISDLLDISCLQSGILKFNFEKVDLVKNLRQSIDELRPRSDAKGIDLSLAVAEDLPEVLADRRRLRSVLLNLIDNAVKFTGRSGSIEVAAAPCADDPRFAQIRVRDTGIGIPESSLRLVFDKFYQVDSSTTRVYEGSGIGLSLAREIVKSHGGQIRVDSVEGEGSTFSFTIPFASSGLPTDIA